jgi:ATP-dependent Clp protease ATP-binding subunit ClpA
MPNEIFQLATVACVFADEVELAEALCFPEISALDERERKWRSCLHSKAKAILEDAELSPAISLHRRKLVATPEKDSIEIKFEPARRSPDWEQPAILKFHYIRWAEEDLHHAVVPGLGVHVFATRASLLPERVEAHIRLVLAGRGRRLSLHRLVEVSRTSEIRLGKLEVSIQRKTPKQIDSATESDEKKQSVLDKLAEELPPLIQRPGETSTSSSNVAAETPAAFELDSELQHLAEMLAGANRRSVLIVGAPGTGKTALVRELARRRRDFGFGHTPFWSTSGARLMTGPIGFGMWQERCQNMCREISKSHAILHLNNLGELLEVGKVSRGGQSVGSFLRPWIARGEVLAIAECTPEQVSAIERDEPHLLAAFQQLRLGERNAEQTYAILQHVLEAAPGKSASDAAAANETALTRLHRLHQRYATYSANPGRPLRFLNNLLADQFPEKQLRDSQVISAFSRETGLPAVLLDDEVPLDLESTIHWFGGHVIGQMEAVQRVVDLLVMIKARLSRPRKPLASFLFIGPTGTGKTEMAKTLARFLFGDPARLVRFDLNEFSDPVSVQRLIGGCQAGSPEGLLTARIREQPFSVVLLDEFEKADPSFFDLLLQILGDGRLTDAAGRVADFCNSVIVMTSNLGAEGFQRGPTGFRREGATSPEAQAHFADAVRKFLRPEIYNRLDAIVPFHALPPDIVLSIARRHLDLLRQRDGIRLRSITWQMGTEVADFLAHKGYHPRYGARPLKRVVERELLVPLAETLNSYQTATPLDVNIGMAEGKIRIQVRAQDDKDTRLQSETTSNLAERIVSQRRRIGRLQRSVATSKLEDEMTMLESLERRLKTANVKMPQLQTRLAKLPKLRQLLEAVNNLSARAQHLETESLGFLYRREPLESALFRPELDALEFEQRKLAREAFGRQHEHPNDILLCFYSEHRETLMEFAMAYHGVGGELGEAIAVDYFVTPPGARSKTSKLLREKPKRLADFFASPPEKLICVAMHLRGDLFLPRFNGEAGLHVIKEKKAERECLIQSAAMPFESYEPPMGIDRQGAIAARGEIVCRTYEREKNKVRDVVLGERPWTSLGIGRCVVGLSEERLNRLIEAATT